jgi:hypothetical protein
MARPVHGFVSGSRQESPARRMDRVKVLVRPGRPRWDGLVPDLLFVLLTVGLFVVLALVVRGGERL